MSKAAAAGNPVVRPATSRDWPVIVAMRDRLNQLELAGCPHAPIRKLSVAEFTAIWGETLDRPSHAWRLVETDGQPVGFGLIYLQRPQVPEAGAFIHWAYVEPACRRQGLGQMLIEHLFDWARARGAGHVELQFIEGNTIAEQFWTKIGFRPYARKCVCAIPPR